MKWFSGTSGFSYDAWRGPFYPADIGADRMLAYYAEHLTAVEINNTFYAMPKVSLPPGRTDEQYIVGLLRATGVLCVYGSGFGTKPEDGFFRVVFLASPDDLARIYGRIAEFTADFLRA